MVNKCVNAPLSAQVTGSLFLPAKTWKITPPHRHTWAPDMIKPHKSGSGSKLKLT